MAQSKTPFFGDYLYDVDLVTSLEATKALALKKLGGKRAVKRKGWSVVVVKVPEGEIGEGWYAATWSALLEPHEEAWVVWRSDDPASTA